MNEKYSIARLQEYKSTGLINQFCGVIILQLLFSICIYSQTEYVRVQNPVYNFLERMDALNIISDFNKFEIPKTRKEISAYLQEVINRNEDLDIVDENILEDLKAEFEYELYGTLKKSQSLISAKDYELFSDSEKYLFYHERKDKAVLFINLIADGELINYKPENGKDHFSSVGILGGEIRGTLLNKFGFYIRGTNGNAFGSREAALQRKDIRYNYKFNSLPGETFFDETEGYLTADFDFIKFKLGRDRVNIGYGSVKPLLGNNSPLFDYFSIKINYEFFNFSFIHGQLLGRNFFQPDSVTGGSQFVENKFLVYHRIGFDISHHFDFGIGEIIVYGDRSIDLSYLNPFSFYKTIEHSNQDRDNAMLFVDANNNSIKGLSIYGTLLIDDISFGKIGSGWWGNQTMLNLGFYSSNLYKIVPFDIRFDYLRIEPYTFTHRLARNNYTNFGYNPGAEVQPNSELFSTQIYYRINHRLNLAVGFEYMRHGANPVNEIGNITNVGGDLLLGHRIFDSESVSFLEGELEYKRSLTFSLSFEPINKIKLLASIIIANQTLKQANNNTELSSFLTLSVEM